MCITLSRIRLELEPLIATAAATTTTTTTTQIRTAE
jgi:hypothetical protein